MKKVSAKKYYEYFDDNIYRHEGVSHSLEFPSKHELIEKYYIHDLKDKILCYRTEKYWEDDSLYHVHHKHKEYFIAD